LKTSRTCASFMLVLIIAVGLSNGCATSLQSAARKGDIQQVKALLDAGADINQSPDDQVPLSLAIQEKHFDVARLLIERGADVNLSTTFSYVPLVYAVQAGNIDMINLLIEKGALVDKDRDGTTPLSWAAYKGNVAVVELLLEKGADLEQGIAHCAQHTTGLWGDFGRRCLSTLRPIKAKRATLARPAAKSKDLSRKDETVGLGRPASDVDTPSPRRIKTNASAYAIVIGIEQYRQKLPRADYATQDARVVADYLTKILGYPEENVVTLLNEHASNVDLAKYFEKWLHNNVDQGSTVFVYYSGHGAPNPRTGDAYLVPYDGDPSFIAETGYSLKRMYGALGKLPAKEIIVALDSCFSGAGGRSVIAKGSRPLVMDLQSNITLSKNIFVLSASSGNQISSTYEEKGHGLFTYFLLKGINDGDVVYENGSIAVNELFRFIKPQVESIARKKYNNEQTPQLIGHGTSTAD
jgi:hypothetical protein